MGTEHFTGCVESQCFWCLNGFECVYPEKKVGAGGLCPNDPYSCKHYVQD